MNLHDHITCWLDELDPNTRRQLRSCQPLQNGSVLFDGREVIDFASNDYLGLANDARLIDRVCETVKELGTSARSSRLVSGNLPLFDKLESRVAELKGTEAALIMGSGFQANSAVLAALTDRRILGSSDKNHNESIQVFSDRLCHASFHFGFNASSVRQIRYRHNDLGHLQELLQKKTSPVKVTLIATESVFSMDGDRLDVATIRKIAKEHDAMLYVDEAHATGVVGTNGMGLMAGQEIDRRNEVVIGTFGKALGGYGSYVACSNNIRDYLVNRCSGLIYSTALPPSVLAAIDAALELVPTLDDRRQHLRQLSESLRERLHAIGLDTLDSTTQIVPVVVGDDAEVMSWAEQLLQAGFLVGAIRPPTVPAGTGRLRISLSSAHSMKQVQQLTEAIAQLKRTGSG